MTTDRKQDLSRAGLQGELLREVRQLREQALTAQITFSDLLQDRGEKAQALSVLLLSLPFLVPMPLPGLSIPFGLCIAAIGVQLLLKKPPWIPKRWRRRELPHATAIRIFDLGEKLAKFFDRLTRTRLAAVHTSSLARNINYTLIVCAGLMLAAPLPPGTNFPPALSIVLIAIGILEQDGLFVVLGYLAFTLTLVFFTALFLLGYKGVLALFS